MNSILALDSNKRVDPILGRAKKVGHEPLQRVLEIALPFVGLVSKGQPWIAVGMEGLQACAHVAEGKRHYAVQEWRALGLDAAKTAVTISSIALTFFFPFARLLISNGVVLATGAYELASHLHQHEWKAATKNLFALAHTALYVASVWHGTAGWIALSLLSQAGLEIYQSYEEYGKGRWPETVAKIVLATIRLYSAAPHLQTLHRNHFGKQLTQGAWESLVWELRDRQRKGGGEMDVESMLIQRGISSSLSDLHISPNYFRGLVFKNIHFSHCNFSDGLFEKAVFSRVTSDFCLFEKTLFIESVVKESQFNHCNFTKAAFIHSLFDRVSIHDSDLSFSAWNDSTLTSVSFLRDKLFETSFLNAQVQKSFLTDSDLTDTLLLDAKSGFTIRGGTPHVVRRPIVALAWHFREQGSFTCLIDEALRDSGAIPLHFEMSPEDVSPEILEKEISSALNDIRLHPSNGQLSIPAEILRRAPALSETAKFKTRAENILRHCQGLALPGGEDIEPELYGAENEDPWGSVYLDYRRSITEISMLAAAHKAGTPTMGTCRGAQMINVYFGGTLKQHVEGQWGGQEISLSNSSKKDWLQSLFGNKIFAFSAHHQAADQIGQNLEVVFENEKIPKLLLSRDNQFMASQVHPEMYRNFQQEDSETGKGKIVVEQNKLLYQLYLERVHHFWRTTQNV
jgi:gamma-glutamyl-gamma-aminobutyrate hydrolase PuuD